MRKREFLYALKRRLSGLSARETAERLNFYSEMIDDKIEDGLTEEAAVLEIGSTEKIAAEILADAPLIKTTGTKGGKTLSAGAIFLLVLGSPVWLSLLIAAFAVIISLCAALWSVVISLWAVFVSFVAAAPASVIAGIIFALCGNALSGVATVGAGLVLSGLAIFIFYGGVAATKGTLLLAKWGGRCIRSCFVRKVSR